MIIDCGSYGGRLFVECVPMSYDIAEPTPNYGLLELCIAVLAGLLIVDGAWQVFRQRS